MNNCNDDKFISRTVLRVTALALALASSASFGLPDDQNQQIDIEALSSEINLNQGLYIYRGTDAEPARITQGSMQISGTEIRIERPPGGVLNKVTATGTPARFQQQPEVDQAVVHASGHTLDYDNGERMLNIDGEAELNQEGNVITAQHIDYNLDSRNANATGSGGGVRMSLSPGATKTP